MHVFNVFEQVKVKPKTSEVELVLRMDIDSENYDRDVPEIMRLQKQVKTHVINNSNFL